ncbi:hypothetical protein AGMMS49992_22920 [Clostridia bacterium]|nr:hypothetical protein AGMMS49992_22920 [Clostridia bacterium]
MYRFIARSQAYDRTTMMVISLCNFVMEITFIMLMYGRVLVDLVGNLTLFIYMLVCGVAIGIDVVFVRDEYFKKKTLSNVVIFHMLYAGCMLVMLLFEVLTLIQSHKSFLEAYAKIAYEITMAAVHVRRYKTLVELRHMVLNNTGV